MKDDKDAGSFLSGRLVSGWMVFWHKYFRTCNLVFEIYAWYFERHVLNLLNNFILNWFSLETDSTRVRDGQFVNPWRWIKSIECAYFHNGVTEFSPLSLRSPCKDVLLKSRSIILLYTKHLNECNTI